VRGVPMGVMAEQLGHADTRTTEKHYAYLAPSYVADPIRAHSPRCNHQRAHPVGPSAQTADIFGRLRNGPVIRARLLQRRLRQRYGNGTVLAYRASYCGCT
jgi:hypothetical protein